MQILSRKLFVHLRILFYVTSVGILLPAWGVAQDSPTLPDNPGPVDYARFIIQEEYGAQAYPGLAVSVWKDGEMIWSEGIGYASLENLERISPSHSLFRIGSISKTLTAAGLAKLVARGRLNLDVPIQTYVPYFPEKRWPVSTRQVAGHIAGIRHYKGLEFFSNVHYNSVQEALGVFITDTLLFEPGTAYAYSSNGWNLVSAAIEGAAGHPFTEYMQTEVFEPLGMEHTYPDDVKLDKLSRVSFYDYLNNTNTLSPDADLSNKWAGGGFLSTSEDLIRFGAGMLNHEIVDPKTTRMFWKSGVLDDGSKTNYGIGWATGKDDAERIWVGHSGGSIGGSSMFLMYPEDELIVVVLINRSRAGARPLGFRIAEQFLKE